MDREANIDSIRALEEEVKEHERAVIKLKRTRNSLLNVSKLPPEVLGNIFVWNVVRKGDFDGLEKRSHNFLLVCHHWIEVALRTPELWGFWGNTPEEWTRWYRCSRTAPLDLVLSGYGHEAKYFDATMRDALKDRAAKDTIRRVHLEAGGLLRSILDSLTPDCEELRSNSMESFVLWNRSKVPVDVSDFFAHYRFPKLRRLNLNNCSASSWDRLTSRTSALTTLELDFSHPSPTPTISQLLSILSSNPALQRVALLRSAVPDDADGKSSARVQLHHLKYLRLDGDLRHIFNLLNRLNHPRNMDILSLTLHGCDDVAASRVVGPSLRDHILRRDRAQNGLAFLASSGYRYRTYRASHVKLRVGDAGGINFSDPAQSQIGTFVEITMLLNGKSHTVRERAVLDLVACIPRDEVAYFKARNNPVTTEDVCSHFPNIRALSFDCVHLSVAFPSPRMDVEGKTFPPLEHILLERVGDEDWSPLMTFLASRVSSGSRLDTLVISDFSDLPPEIVGDIRGMVRELKVDQQGRLLPLFDAGPDPF